MVLKIRTISIAIMLAALGSASPAFAATVKLRIIETTDLHANMMDYDYYKDVESEKIGLVRAASLVEKAQKEVTNSVLVDNGDLIQGSPMGDYIAAKGLKPKDVHPAFKAMNSLKYDVGNIGNHEFNYGLAFLHEAINDAAFPYISANVYDAKTGKHAFTPYLIKKYTFLDTDGRSHNINIGYIGFVPPQIMLWDKKHLDGKLIAKDIVKTAEQLVPRMKAKGADVIIAIPHSGLSIEPYRLMAENSVYHLASVNGIDAIAFGHAHAVFPGRDFDHIEGIDNKIGTIKGIAAVMPGRWGSHIGIMDLELERQLGQWKVVPIKSEARPIFTDKSVAKPNLAMRKALLQDHKNTREFVNQPLGKAEDVMYSFLALVQDDPTIQIVNLAQIDYVERFVQGDPDLAHLPVLSAAAPFKAGGRRNDPSGYTEVEAGELTFRNAADLYLYPNTLVALKVTGAELKEWLECSAGQFNQINPDTSEKQNLINWDDFRTYNFDVIDGVNYQIDVTKPARYDEKCQIADFNSGRIVNLTYQGKAVDPKQHFLVATNNYRAYLGVFPGTGNEHIAFASPDESRTVLANYIRRVSEEKGSVLPSADNNWSFKPIDTNKKLNVVFETSPSSKAAKFIEKKAQYPMKMIAIDDIGFAVYEIDLTKKNQTNPN